MSKTITVRRKSSNKADAILHDAFRFMEWPVDYVYRDSWIPNPVSNMTASGGGSGTGIIAFSQIEVVGTGVTVGNSNAGAFSALPTAPDEKTHTPPRVAFVPMRFLVIATVGATLPSPYTAPAISVTFTAATTDVCTSTAHGFIDGDLVTVSTSSALPAGLASTSIYSIIKLSADTFKLKLNAAIVDITGTGTGTHTITLLSTAAWPTPALAGVLFIPEDDIAGYSITE